MSPKRGKLVTVSVVALGTAILFTAVVGLKDAIFTKWYAFQLTSNEEASRWNAALELEKLAPPIAEEWYLEELSVRSGQGREQAAQRLATMASTKAIPLLITILGEEGPHVTEGRNFRNHFGLLVLAEIGRAAVPFLVDELKSADPWTRYVAVRALEKIGPEAFVAAPFLVEEFRRTRVRRVQRPRGRGFIRTGPQFAQRALQAIGHGVEPILVAALHDQSIQVRRSAAETLASLGPKSKEAVEELSSRLRDDE